MKKLLLNIQMFANPTIPTGIHEIQEQNATEVKKFARKELKVRNFFSSDYEGLLQNGAVKVPVRDTEVVVGDYDVAAGKAITTQGTTYETLVVDVHKAVNELIDGYEANAVPDNVKDQRIKSAGYALGLTLEQDAILELETNGTANASTTKSTKDTIYENIAKDVAELTKLGIPVSDIISVVSIDSETLLLTDQKFTNSASSVGADRMASGVIGKIRGAETVNSALLADDVEYIVFAKGYAQKGDAWIAMPKIVSLDGSTTHVGASALKGRVASLNKLTRSYACRVKKFI